jgi:hypothetical protein
MGQLSLTPDPDVESGAQITPSGTYRYRLWRAWGEGDRLGFVMLNPSTADAMLDDQTIRRCMFYARRDGFAGIEVVNLFAWRATQPTDLPAELAVAEGPDNEQFIQAMLDSCPTVVAAWGATLADVVRRRRWLDPRRRPMAMAKHAGTDLRCLGRTSAGHPRHPSRLGNDQALEAFTG